jgi:hypothetical protein
VQPRPQQRQEGGRDGGVDAEVGDQRAGTGHQRGARQGRQVPRHEDADAAGQVAEPAQASVIGRQRDRRRFVDHQLRREHATPRRARERRCHHQPEREAAQVEQQARDHRGRHRAAATERGDGRELRAAGEHQRRVADRDQWTQARPRADHAERDAEGGDRRAQRQCAADQGTAPQGDVVGMGGHETPGP